MLIRDGGSLTRLILLVNQAKGETCRHEQTHGRFRQRGPLELKLRASKVQMVLVLV